MEGLEERELLSRYQLWKDIFNRATMSNVIGNELHLSNKNFDSSCSCYACRDCKGCQPEEICYLKET